MRIRSDVKSQTGIMEEMLQDTLEMNEDDEIEEEADAEVEQVLFELTNGKLGTAGTVSTELPVRDFLFPTLSFQTHLCFREQMLKSRTPKLRGRWKTTELNWMVYSVTEYFVTCTDSMMYRIYFCNIMTATLSISMKF